jgi:hypothetical protein
MKVHMDQAEALEHVTPFLFVGNNRYQTSGVHVGTRSKLDSGRLWVCTAPTSGRRNVISVAMRTLAGRATDQELNAFETEELWVEPGTARVNVSTDGEVSIMDAPLHYKIRPHSLGVVGLRARQVGPAAPALFFPLSAYSEKSVLRRACLWLALSFFLHSACTGTLISETIASGCVLGGSEL